MHKTIEKAALGAGLFGLFTTACYYLYYLPSLLWSEGSAAFDNPVFLIWTTHAVLTTIAAGLSLRHKNTGPKH